MLHHVAASTQLLGRAYAGRAAVGELDEQGQRERQMIEDFRASLRPVSWRWWIVAGAVATVLLGRVIVGLVATSIEVVASGFRDERFGLGEQQRRAVLAVLDGLTAAASSLSSSSLVVVVEDLGRAGPTGLLILAVGLLSSAYVVLRPVSTAFRLKRLLFNLAEAPDGALVSTTSTWHVRRSIGLYEQERRCLVGAGVPARMRERSFDLALSVLIALLVSCGLASALLSDHSVARAERAGYAAFILPFLMARLSWLGTTWRSRRSDQSIDCQSPTGVLLPVTGRVADVRPVTEAAAMGASLYLTPVVWYRLSRQMASFRAEAAARSCARLRSLPRWALPLTAVASTFYWPFMLIPRLIIARELAPHTHSRFKLWSPAVLLVGTYLTLAVAFSRVPLDVFTAVALPVILSVNALCFASLQATQNTIARTYADPLMYDIVPSRSEPTSHHARVPVQSLLPRQWKQARNRHSASPLAAWPASWRRSTARWRHSPQESVALGRVQVPSQAPSADRSVDAVPELLHAPVPGVGTDDLGRHTKKGSVRESPAGDSAPEPHGDRSGLQG